jgi:hypothetical protein
VRSEWAIKMVFSKEKLQAIVAAMLPAFDNASTHVEGAKDHGRISLK